MKAKKKSLLLLLTCMLILSSGCGSPEPIDFSQETEEFNLQEELQDEFEEMIFEEIEKSQEPSITNQEMNLDEVEQEVYEIAKEARQVGLSEEEIREIAINGGFDPDAVMRAVNELGGVTAPAEPKVETEEIPEDNSSLKEPQGLTKDEITELAQHYDGQVVAVKKGDTYYINDTWECIKQGDLLVTSTTEVEPISISYDAGDSIVIFSDGSLAPLTVFYMPDDTDRYCIPATFLASVDDSIHFIAELDSLYKSSYIDGTINTPRFNEYGGTKVYENANHVSELEFGFVLEGEKDEIIEFGTYKGTTFETSHYKCNAKYYRLEMPIISGKENKTLDDRDFELTKEGYAIVSNSEKNRINPGFYLISNIPFYIEN